MRKVKEVKEVKEVKARRLLKRCVGKEVATVELCVVFYTLNMNASKLLWDYIEARLCLACIGLVR